MSDPSRTTGNDPEHASEAEETLRAIREGEIDALVIRRSVTEEIFTLHGGESSYRAFMETMDHGALALGSKGEILYANKAFCEFLGEQLSGLQGHSLLDHLSGSTRQKIAQLLERAKSEKQTVEISIEQDGGARYFLASAAPLDTGVVAGFALTLTDLTDRVRAEESSVAERAARAIIASANEAVVVCDIDGRITHANAAVHTVEAGDLVGKLFSEAIKLKFSGSTGLVRTEDIISMVLAGSSVQGIEAQAPDAPDVKDLLISAAPLSISGEGINGCVVTMVNLSRRKAAERQQLLLMGELDHRVKNTLALVLSISSRTLANSNSLEDFQKAFAGRIQALAKTHNLLAEKSWSNLTLIDIVTAELVPFVSLGDGRIRLEGLDIAVTPRAATAIGLVFHELATNAVKYGALSSDAGQLVLRAEPDAGPQFLKLEWIESGGPRVEEPTRKGFGRTVISRSMQYSSGGGADLTFHPDGVRCTIQIPAEDVLKGSHRA